MFQVNAHDPLGCRTHRNVSIQRQAFRGTALAAHAVLPVLLARPMQCQRGPTELLRGRRRADVEPMEQKVEADAVPT